MALSVIVCDDSKFARSQLVRGLPEELKTNLKEASDGAQALDIIKSGFGELMFLDLNMPNMDGYEVLQEIKKQNLDILVIVITGDVQAEAEKRIMSLGALAYIKKPLDLSQLNEVLIRYGLADIVNDPQELGKDQGVTYLDKLQEVTNIAMGKAAKKIAELLNIFVKMPIPVVTCRTGSQLYEEMNAEMIEDGDLLVSSGFCGSRMEGEIVIFYAKSAVDNLLHILVSDDDVNEGRVSTMIDLSNLIISTLMSGIAEFLGAQFSRTHPSFVRLNQNIQLSDSLADTRILNVKMTYTIPDQNINITLWILFTEASQASVAERLSYI